MASLDSKGEIVPKELSNPEETQMRKEPLPTSSSIHIEHAPNSNFSATLIKPLP